MRLIDKEALCGLLADKALEAQLEDERTELEIKECLSVVRQMPEAVVRCRECKHFRHYGKTSLFMNGKNIKAGWCQRRISYDEEYRMTADDFCNYGERKDGDK